MKTNLRNFNGEIEVCSIILITHSAYDVVWTLLRRQNVKMMFIQRRSDVVSQLGRFNVIISSLDKTVHPAESTFLMSYARSFFYIIIFYDFL